MNVKYNSIYWHGGTVQQQQWKAQAIHTGHFQPTVLHQGSLNKQQHFITSTSTQERAE